VNPDDGEVNSGCRACSILHDCAARPTLLLPPQARIW
jgi:hypothetical protein